VDATKLNDWMQIVGIFAVVGSLIFVGMEMRQAQEISMSLEEIDRGVRPGFRDVLLEINEEIETQLDE